MIRLRSNSLPMAILLAACFTTSYPVPAYAGTALSTKDKQFLHDLGEDSNFEMASAKLALQKSPSADVKAYAQMILVDHRRLQQDTIALARAVKQAPVPPDSMSVPERTELVKLQILSGKSFDDAYIQGLIGGNEDIEKLEKSESSSGSIEAIKVLAQHSTTIDSKHAEKAKELARAHHLQSR